MLLKVENNFDKDAKKIPYRERVTLIRSISETHSTFLEQRVAGKTECEMNWCEGCGRGWRGEKTKQEKKTKPKQKKNFGRRLWGGGGLHKQRQTQMAMSKARQREKINK